MKSIANVSNPLNVYEFFKQGLVPLQSIINWIPFSQFKNLKEIARGGFGIIYKAHYSVGVKEYNINRTDYSYTNTSVAIKRFINSKDISKYFLNEVIIQFFLHIYIKRNFNLN